MKIDMTIGVDGEEYRVSYALDRYDGNKAVHTMVYKGHEVKGDTFDHVTAKVVSVIRNTVSEGKA